MHAYYLLCILLATAPYMLSAPYLLMHPICTCTMMHLHPGTCCTPCLFLHPSDRYLCFYCSLMLLCIPPAPNRCMLSSEVCLTPGCTREHGANFPYFPSGCTMLSSMHIACFCILYAICTLLAHAPYMLYARRCICTLCCIFCLFLLDFSTLWCTMYTICIL